MNQKKKKRMFENIYDLLVESKFQEEAREELRQFIKRKDVKWDGDNNIISIGKHFKIKLL